MNMNIDMYLICILYTLYTIHLSYYILLHSSQKQLPSAWNQSHWLAERLESISLARRALGINLIGSPSAWNQSHWLANCRPIPSVNLRENRKRFS